MRRYCSINVCFRLLTAGWKLTESYRFKETQKNLLSFTEKNILAKHKTRSNTTHRFYVPLMSKISAPKMGQKVTGVQEETQKSCSLYYSLVSKECLGIKQTNKKNKMSKHIEKTWFMGAPGQVTSKNLTRNSAHTRLSPLQHKCMTYK